MGHTFYTKEQEQWLIDNYDSYENISSLCSSFNKKFNQTKNNGCLSFKCEKMGLKKKERYSEEEKQWLKENYKKYNSLKYLYEAYLKAFDNPRSYNTLSKYLSSLGLIYSPHHRFSQEEKNWLKNNYLKYNAKLLTEKFNTQFNTHFTSTRLSHYSASLGYRVSDNAERVSLEKKERYSTPIGGETTFGGVPYVKVSNKFKDQNHNWVLKTRAINNATSDDEVYIIDPTKPITKENTICVNKKYHANISNLHFNDLAPELRPLAIKVATLKYIHKHLEEKE